MEKEIEKTFQYFGFFDYAPLKDEIYSFLEKKAPYKVFEAKMKTLVFNKRVKALPISPVRYTLGEYTISGSRMVKKIRKSIRKIKKVALYVKILAIFPQIKLIGLSGSLAMLNADDEADVDIFIISARSRLWTARFISIGLAKLLGIHRSYNQKHLGDKVCLNLFFDESHLAIMKQKRNEYVAHEVLQMKPQKVKGNSYLMYLDSNRWVFDIFPNAKKLIRPLGEEVPMKNVKQAFLGGFFEGIFKKIQLRSIKRRRTSEIITAHQLWFFPDDFETKILRHKVPSAKKGK